VTYAVVITNFKVVGSKYQTRQKIFDRDKRTSLLTVCRVALILNKKLNDIDTWNIDDCQVEVDPRFLKKVQQHWIKNRLAEGLIS
jgi:hypothetical protein